MKVTIPDLESTLLTVITTRSNLSSTDAKLVASEYVEGELQGKKSHGLAAFPDIIDALSDANTDFEILRETESFLYIDAHEGFGAVIGRDVSDLLMEKARHQGVAFASIRNMKSWRRPATIAQYVAENNMVAWVVNTAGPQVAPPGGKERVIGTNPIGIGIPAGDTPVIIDMATATRAWGEVRLTKQYNDELPKNAYLDRDGVPTQDAEAAYSAIPMGEYKGFGLGLFIELLGGSFVGMNMGAGGVDSPHHVHNRGAAILVINPEMTVGKEMFESQSNAFVESIRTSTPAKGNKTVTIPGDRATANKKRNVRNGHVEVDERLWRKIKALL